MPHVAHQLHVEVARMLQPQFDYELVVDEWWGIRMKAMPHANYYLGKMLLVNWRLHEVPADDPYYCARSWCYSGISPNQALIAALTAVISWDGAEGSEPGMWIKSIHDQRKGKGEYGWETPSSPAPEAVKTDD